MRRVVLVAVVVVAACKKGTPSLDHADVQANVAAEAAKQVGVKGTATCPNATPAAGSSFTCTVAFQGGGTLPFKVDQVDAAGNLTVAPVGDWLLGDMMERDLTTEMFLIGQPKAKVECGDAIMPVSLPANVQCTVTNGGATKKIAVAVAANRDVTWTPGP